MQRGEKIDDHAQGRDRARGRWTSLPAGQELVEDKLRTLTDALGDLKIVGVRPRPPGLKNLDQEDLKLTPDGRRCRSRTRASFSTRQGLFSDQGDVLVTTDEGVVYTLRYGGPIFAEGDELIVGRCRRRREEGRAGQERRRQEGEDHPGEPVPDGDGLVRPDADRQARVDGAEARGEADRPVNIPDKPFAPDPNDPKYLADQKEAKEKADRDKADYEKKIADGQKKVEELTDRFGPWYYVTPGESFRSINLDRAAITQPKKPPARRLGDAGFRGPGGMPPGFPPLRRP